MKVTLIGAGPGDFGLLTIKAVERLKQADVVLYDRLISDEILKLIPEKAEKINVGKNTSNHTIPQNEINQLLLIKALNGLNVVRLKGGDPFVFGRGGEELELLSENNIPFEVIPGISSATSAGAYAGIPVTHRDYNSSLHIITGHAKKGGELNIDFEALNRLNGTLVFMMSVSTLSQICNGLITAGMSKEMPAAIVENATTTKQRKFISTVGELPKVASENNITSPSIIIVGRVCELSNKYDWFMNRSLFGKKIVVTRTKNTESTLSNALKELGAEVIEVPSISIKPNMKGFSKLESAVAQGFNYKWIVFSTSIEVRMFFEFLKEQKIDVRKLNQIKIAVVDSGTEQEVNKNGLFVDYVPSTNIGMEFANELINSIKDCERVLVFKAKTGLGKFINILESKRIGFECVDLYDTQYETEELQKKLDKLDYITFTNSSSVMTFIQTNLKIDFKDIPCICIGESTAKSAKDHGFNVITSEKPTIASMIEKIEELYKK